MMTNPLVPAGIRRLINVESGLNDGIATPFVSLALAGAATAGHGTTLAHAGTELALGVVIGAAVGGAGGVVVSAARKRGWAADGFAGSAVLALAVCAYAGSVALHGNGFIAAFIGGIAFGTTGGRRGAPLVPFVEEAGALVSLLVWLAFGAVVVVPAVKDLTWQIMVYAVLSLTVVRMIPVAVALTGSRIGWPARAFVGWFGPRGLASVVFGLLALEDLGQAAEPAVTVISITVLLSVVAHGVTAEPLARRSAAALSRAAGGPAPAERPEVPTRKLIRHRPGEPDPAGP
jgi:NhaP-type Na+/H+ or K+/H+ antiporter